jgi:hypothetical protein
MSSFSPSEIYYIQERLKKRILLVLILHRHAASSDESGGEANHSNGCAIKISY